MSKPISNIFIHIFLLASISIYGQSISSRVVDTKTNEGIPYATVQFAENRGIITNEEGRFSINLSSRLEQQDSIYISSMGYKKTAIHFKAALDSVIYIEPKAIELNEVYLFNNDLIIDEIIEKIKEASCGQNFTPNRIPYAGLDGYLIDNEKLSIQDENNNKLKYNK